MCEKSPIHTQIAVFGFITSSKFVRQPPHHRGGKFISIGFLAGTSCTIDTVDFGLAKATTC